MLVGVKTCMFEERYLCLNQTRGMVNMRDYNDRLDNPSLHNEIHMTCLVVRNDVITSPALINDGKITEAESADDIRGSLLKISGMALGAYRGETELEWGTFVFEGEKYLLYITVTEHVCVVFKVLEPIFPAVLAIFDHKNFIEC